ncbi:MAG: hypothetical protein F4X42_09475 [Rhodospirillaceae bacterium]|nr:hypothetical protein [Rhodospirillaceae bacterium]MYB13469.1 hypothetical protein [Rhodospirillaceae bacterium]
MTKQKKPKKRWRFRKVEVLEQLLKTEDPDSYGLVCWHLANRGTERYRAGDVINLGAWEKAGVNRKFRLTDESIENINRCLGMRTHAEASSLFAEFVQIEAHGECPRGHQDAALDYMMYGIKPTRPCPECGEIPKFGDMVTSLGFGSSEPVKGIDGNTYEVCPDCGDDMLQLQGTDPVGWGWNIVCTNCGWQLKQAEELDIQQYSDLMEEIKLKIEAIQRLLAMPGIINQTRVESVCLQLRMVLELIIFGSLVSNKDAWRKSQDELRKAWNIKKIMKDLRAIHAKYYPEPKEKVGDFLTEDRLVTVYDRLNKIIHAENPLGTGIDLRHYMESIPQWLMWILKLLTDHKVFLYHHPNVVYWIRLFGGPEGTVLCTPIRVDSDNKEICMWPDCVQQENRQHCEYIYDSWQKCQLRALEPNQTEAKRMAEAYDR